MADDAAGTVFQATPTQPLFLLIAKITCTKGSAEPIRLLRLGDPEKEVLSCVSPKFFLDFAPIRNEVADILKTYGADHVINVPSSLAFEAQFEEESSRKEFIDSYFFGHMRIRLEGVFNLNQHAAFETSDNDNHIVKDWIKLKWNLLSPHTDSQAKQIFMDAATQTRVTANCQVFQSDKVCQISQETIENGTQTEESFQTQARPKRPDGIELLDLIVMLVELNWYMLGLYLGIPKETLDHIKRDYAVQGHRRCRIEMLHSWQKIAANQTWEDVLKAVVQMGSLKLAQRIADKYEYAKAWEWKDDRVFITVLRSKKISDSDIKIIRAVSNIIEEDHDWKLLAGRVSPEFKEGRIKKITTSYDRDGQCIAFLKEWGRNYPDRATLLELAEGLESLGDRSAIKKLKELLMHDNIEGSTIAVPSGCKANLSSCRVQLAGASNQTASQNEEKRLVMENVEGYKEYLEEKLRKKNDKYEKLKRQMTLHEQTIRELESKASTLKYTEKELRDMKIKKQELEVEMKSKQHKITSLEKKLIEAKCDKQALEKELGTIKQELQRIQEQKKQCNENIRLLELKLVTTELNAEHTRKSLQEKLEREYREKNELELQIETKLREIDSINEKLKRAELMLKSDSYTTDSKKISTANNGEDSSGNSDAGQRQTGHLANEDYVSTDTPLPKEKTRSKGFLPRFWKWFRKDEHSHTESLIPDENASLDEDIVYVAVPLGPDDHRVVANTDDESRQLISDADSDSSSSEIHS